MRLTYERLKEEVKASHILIMVEPDASPADTLKAYTRIVDIRNKILQGEDFAAAAIAYSEDKSAKVNQGSLGYFSSLQMVYPFETAAYQTPVGQVSLPVRTRYGYHILKVFDRRPARGEVEVSHIMIRTSDEKDLSKAKNTIFTIYEQLQAGVKWEELCKQYSEDPATKDSGGKLRPFGTGGMAGVPNSREQLLIREPWRCFGSFSNTVWLAYCQAGKKNSVAKLRRNASNTEKSRDA
jgi:peptidyl-prolyl cis-trans isomerase SurA